VPQLTAGVLLYRHSQGGLEVLLIHLGGPFWQKKDAGAWSLPKGFIEPSEDAATAARREFTEETGGAAPAELTLLGDFRLSGNKILTAFAAEGDFDTADFRSNSFTMEWPPKSGRMAAFPEADRAAWFGLTDAAAKVATSQRPILDALAVRFAGS
jgi:predicted NUDIX family NTP pyrophosphohydrolase